MNWFVEKLNREQGASATDDADAGLADRIAEALRTERAAELAAAAAPPPPAAPEPPAWLFGPRHRELDAQRQAAAEAARHAPDAPDAPPAAPLPKLCPCCLQPLPGGGL
jgi:hypothetical protein